MSPTVRWLGRGTTRTQGHGPVTLFGALIAATLDLKVALLPEGPDLTVQAEARGWGWDGDWRAGDPSFSLLPAPTCQAPSVSPDVAVAGEQHDAQVTPSSKSLSAPRAHSHAPRLPHGTEP